MIYFACQVIAIGQAHIRRSRKRSFISPASFHIFNRLCDSLVLLVIVYGKYYPNQPFCPWLLGTEFVEHFFGLAQMILPNFTYAELLKMIQNVMVRQRILLTGKLKENRERTSASGYILDYDPSPLSSKEHNLALVNLATLDLNGLVELAFKEASSICRELLGMPVPTIGPDAPLNLAKVGAPQRKSGRTAKAEDAGSSSSEENELSDVYYSGGEEEGTGFSNTRIGELTGAAAYNTARYSVDALCEDFGEAVTGFNETPKFCGPPLPNSSSVTPSPTTAHTAPKCHSDLLDDKGTVTITRMLDARRKLQSQTSTNSEWTVELDAKFALRKVTDEVGKIQKMTSQEASQRVRIAQTLAGLLEKEKEYLKVGYT
jgi:hypothetical protein